MYSRYTCSKFRCTPRRNKSTLREERSTFSPVSRLLLQRLPSESVTLQQRTFDTHGLGSVDIDPEIRVLNVKNKVLSRPRLDSL